MFGSNAVPEGSDEKTEMEVYNFTGAGGVALSMYNTDEVCFARPSQNFLLNNTCIGDWLLFWVCDIVG